MTQDDRDFFDMMADQADYALNLWVEGKLKGGMDPRDIASLLDYYAKRAQGWCVGRYGKARAPTPAKNDRLTGERV